MNTVSRGKLKFKSSCGIYYDNPGLVVDKTKCRGVLGVFIDKSEIPHAQEFIKKEIAFNIKSLPGVYCVSTNVPYKNFFTFFLLGKFYGQIMNYI